MFKNVRYFLIFFGGIHSFLDPMPVTITAGDVHLIWLRGVGGVRGGGGGEQRGQLARCTQTIGELNAGEAFKGGALILNFCR